MGFWKFMNSYRVWFKKGHSVITNNVGCRATPGSLLPAMLHLLSERQETTHVPLLLQVGLPKLPPHLDWGVQTRVPPLQKNDGTGQFRRLRKVRQRHKTPAFLDGQQLKNKREMPRAQNINDLLLRGLPEPHLPRLRHVRKSTPPLTQHRGH